MPTSLEQPHDSPTAETTSEIECRDRGQQIVRDLELFLGAALAIPNDGRFIPFLAEIGNRSMQIQGTKPW